jgi:hypothetical protein
MARALDLSDDLDLSGTLYLSVASSTRVVTSDKQIAIRGSS